MLEALYPEHLHHLVTEVIDDLDCDATGIRPVEEARDVAIERCLVPLPIEICRSSQDGKVLGVDEHLETSSPSRGSVKEPPSLQDEDHLVNARRGDGKEPLQVGLGGQSSVDLRVGMSPERSSLWVGLTWIPSGQFVRRAGLTRCCPSCACSMATTSTP